VDSALEQRKLEVMLREMLAVGAARREDAVTSVQCMIPVIVREALLDAVLGRNILYYWSYPKTQASTGCYNPSVSFY
jgi:hypothetical protein